MARTVSRSGSTGRFVSARAAAARPRTSTNREVVGGKSANQRTVTRSLTTGRFVPTTRGKSDPNGTIRQKV